MLKALVTPGASLMTIKVGRNRKSSSRAYARMDASSTHTEWCQQKYALAIISAVTLECEGAPRRDCKKGKRFSSLFQCGSNRFEDRATS
eukprot:2308769-Prymnesium_polylepis.1